MDIAAQRRLLTALIEAAGFPHPVGRISLIETHISFVVLTGSFAYKIKKAIRLGFLDFSTLTQRHFYCDEELRLNRRLAAPLYLEVVAIGGSVEAPRLGDGTPAIEYAVKMREFAQDCLLDRVLARGDLAPAQLDELARLVADFHRHAAVAGGDDGFGTPAAVAKPMLENFVETRDLLESGEDHAELDAIESWSRRAFADLELVFAARRDAACIRECHGDLHLGNIVLLADGLHVFDCIEFNPNLRWIDVISEVAFLVMDLAERGRPDFAWRALNAYLEEGGDYAGLRVLPFYLVYRAVVRAKVARIRAAQPDLAAADRAAALTAWRAYVDYARRIIAPPPPALLITHGFSGSGKTFVAQAVLEAIGAIRVRSDVERKRLHRLAPLAASASTLTGGIYDTAATTATYGRLADLARQIIGAGYAVIVDAAFLDGGQRDRFRRLAGELAVPFAILDCHTTTPMLYERVAARHAGGADASEATAAVLQHQLATAEPLSDAESALALRFNTATGDLERSIATLQSRLGR